MWWFVAGYISLIPIAQLLFLFGCLARSSRRREVLKDGDQWTTH